ncbi:hypothetical protein VKT23_006566 [Stygiomarasmius scandens]|uniref:Phosphoglycerate mutase n=1 Tax=Marasmiellus scandens TaxID=2682957 RepID=A0ABR1JQ78_9AGAR
MLETRQATFTFIRHGESQGNVRPVWAGQTDDELSELGKEQANALGEWFAENETKFDRIYVSKLKRARQTAEAIQHHANPTPPLIEEQSLHEIDFGDADGKPYVADPIRGHSLEEHYKEGIYPHIHNRTDRFPGGESKDDVARRAERVIQDLIIPMITKDTTDTHIAIVSHGVFLKELFYELHRQSGELVQYKCLDTTGWTRMKINILKLQGREDVRLPIILEVMHVNKREHWPTRTER